MLRGVEIFPGMGTPLSRTTRYGATFVASERRGVIMLGWVNYTPLFFKPGTECTVVGGRWFILVRERGIYCGLLRGLFTKGLVCWDRRADIAQASLGMKGSGGTRECRDAVVYGSMMATLDHLPFPPAPPSIVGELKLTRSV